MIGFDPEKMQGFQKEAFRIMKEAERTLGGTVPWPDYFATRTAEHVLLVLKLSAILDSPAANCLEIGCGQGYTLLLWALLLDSVTGIDEAEPISRAQHAVQIRPDLASRITLVSGNADNITGLDGSFDMVFSQYVLEHLKYPLKALTGIRRVLKPGGTVVHVVNNLVDRLDWHAVYRNSVSWLGRLRRSVRNTGLARTLVNPGAFTPPHEPAMGSNEKEQSAYRLERWTGLFMEAGYEVLDYFQTRDTNWVIVTRPM